jgi:DNA invertase Pin-like site-specific DNA recombinase
VIKQQQNMAALYLRLSRDDGGDAESNSIQTQRMMLQRYCRENGIPVYAEYIDDGISGVTFERDGFKRMIADIEDGRLNTVICKDLSRLGRNNAMVAYYTELFFPDNDVRLIALNDSIDTGRGENEIMAFKSVINEYYARDISKKVRSSRTAR